MEYGVTVAMNFSKDVQNSTSHLIQSAPNLTYRQKDSSVGMLDKMLELRTVLSQKGYLLCHAKNRSHKG